MAVKGSVFLALINYNIPYLFDNTPHEYRFLPCGVTVVSFNIYLFLTCGVVQDQCK